jgi:hypothetical protein
MTLDELRLLYNDAYHKTYNPAAYHLEKEDLKAQRAGIRAVVTALRDDIGMNGQLDEDYSVYKWMNKILASDE